MKQFFVTISLFLTTFYFATAQVELIPVVEHFTNTRCSVCASRNPGFYNNFNAVSGVDTFPSMTYFSIHPSSPYTACFLSQQNKIQNDTRTNYYGIYGSTPQFVINGQVASGNTNLPSLFSPYYGLKTAYSIRLETFALGADSIQSNIVIKKHAVDNSTTALYVGLVEDTVFGNGGNGETFHINVLRNSITTDSGMLVSLAGLSVGDSLIVIKNTATKSIWNKSRMKTVAILRNSVTGSILQSSISTKIENIVAGVKEESFKSEFEIYPNPAAASFVIDSKNNEYYTFKVLNAIGSVVLSGNLQGKNSISVIDISSGIYVIQISFGELNFSKKIYVAN